MENKNENFLDIRGVVCPMTWMKTKMMLEKLSAGTKLEVVVDNGEPITSLPRQVKDEGHKIVSVQREGECFRVIIEKK